jgi:hypothetical protein
MDNFKYIKRIYNINRVFSYNENHKVACFEKNRMICQDTNIINQCIKEQLKIESKYGSDNIIKGNIKSPEIDYANSKIKGKNFITYLSNLKYESVNINLNGVSFEERSELVSEFIKHNSLCHINQLEITLIKCLFYFRGYNLSLVDESEDDKLILEHCIFSNEEVQEYVERNKDLIKQLSGILDGVLLYAIKNLTAYKEELGDFITNNIVTEKQDIGKTFVNLFNNI